MSNSELEDQAAEKETHRAFAAFALPEAALERVAEIGERLVAAGVKGKWTRDGQWHVTVHFFGDQPVSRLRELARSMDAFRSRLKDVVFEMTGLDAFGRPPRVLFLELVDSDQAAARLVADFQRENALVPDKPWKAHLTLARFRSPDEAKTWTRVREGFSAPEPFRFAPTSLTLYTSELTRNGPVYCPFHIVS